MDLKLFHTPNQKSGRPRTRAQATIEFMLALPILLLIIFGIIDFALLFQAWLSVQNIARQTVRYAVTGEFDTAHCVDMASDGACAGVNKEAEEDAARLASIHDVADSFIIGLMEDPAVTNQLLPDLSMSPFVPTGSRSLHRRWACLHRRSIRDVKMVAQRWKMQEVQEDW